MKGIILIIIILLVVIGGYFIFSTNLVQAPQETPGQGEEKSEEVIGEVSEEKVIEAREITVSGSEFIFNPSSITLKAGEMVRLIFTNKGSAPHDLRIEELGIGTKVIRAGETDTIEFEAPSSGEYTFFCSVPGHRKAGMEGKLEVIE